MTRQRQRQENWEWECQEVSVVLVCPIKKVLAADAS